MLNELRVIPINYTKEDFAEIIFTNHPVEFEATFDLRGAKDLIKDANEADTTLVSSDLTKLVENLYFTK